MCEFNSWLSHLLVTNVFSHWQHGVQTMLKSHNLKRHVTRGQDKNADSVKTHKHSNIWAFKSSPYRTIVIVITHPSNANKCFRDCNFLVTPLRLLMFHTMQGYSQKQIDEKYDMQGLWLWSSVFLCGSTVGWAYQKKRKSKAKQVSHTTDDFLKKMFYF